MDENTLIVLEGTHYKEMAMEAARKADLASLIPGRHCRIGIKPNLVARILPDQGATTHPELVDGILEYLLEHGFDQVYLLESAWVGDNTEETIRYLGYDRLAAQYGIPFYNLEEDQAVLTDCAGMELRICRRALETEFLINMPVLKGHCQTRMTGALKNLKGLLPDSEKRRFHSLGLHKPIAHLNAKIRPGFVLADCICPDLTFEDGGNPVALNRVAAAVSPVLCDLYGCALIGADPADVGYLKLAEEMGLGSLSLEDARLEMWKQKPAGPCDPCTGNEQTAWIRCDEGFPQAGAAAQGGYRHMMRIAENVEEVDSCSACYAYLIPALEKLEAEGLLSRLKEKIAIGQGYRGKTGKLGIGNCTKCFERHLDGCPPTENQMFEFLKTCVMTDTVIK